MLTKFLLFFSTPLFGKKKYDEKITKRYDLLELLGK